MRVRRLFHRLHVTTILLLLIAITIPMTPLVVTTFTQRMPWPLLIPDFWSLRSWQYVLSPDAGTGSAILVSLFIAVMVTIINLVLAIPAADALARYSIAGKRWLEAVIYAPILVPSFVSIMGMYITFLRLGLTETIFGVILAHLSPSLPYMIRSLMISYGTLGFEWEEQGRMLGANSFNRFRYIVLPHILPGIAAGAGVSMLVSLSQYLITFLVGGGRVVTLPILLFPFASGGDAGIAAVYVILFAGLAAAVLWGLDMYLRWYYARR